MNTTEALCILRTIMRNAAKHNTAESVRVVQALATILKSGEHLQQAEAELQELRAECRAMGRYLSTSTIIATGKRLETIGSGRRPCH